MTMNDDLEIYFEEEPQLIDFLRDAKIWSDFAASLWDWYHEKGQLTPKQRDAAMKMMNAVKARECLENKQIKTDIQFTNIVDLFHTASQKIRKPRIRLLGITLSMASPTSKNPHDIYVKRDEVYLGKISPNSQFTAGYSLSAERKDEVIKLLEQLNDEPLETAIQYGRETGQCACCGRTLTNPVSIDLGIGPICRSRWGM